MSSHLRYFLISSRTPLAMDRTVSLNKSTKDLFSERKTQAGVSLFSEVTNMPGGRGSSHVLLLQQRQREDGAR